jgi:cyclophilin family peptidyl-prolyl cis-trans isomerase
MEKRDLNTNIAIAVGIVVVAGAVVFFANRANNAATMKDAYSTDSTSTAANQQITIDTDKGVITATNNLNPKSMHTVTIETNKGTIVFETFDEDAPLASANFIKLAQKGFYDSVIFHRVIKGFMIQGGDPTGTGAGGPGYTFADELSPNTPSAKLGYQKGIVAMANAGPNTNGSQFFIMLANNPLPHSYTIFGRVVSGQDVVDAIGSVPTGSNDKPVTPVVMKKVTVK